MDIVQEIGLYGLVPVAAINDAKDAVDTARALCQGGLPVIEVTMRTEAGVACIDRMREAFPDMLVGAGTVLNLEKCKESVKAGARYIVSPGFNEAVVAWCCENGVPVLPGVTSPTELERALAYGLKILKFFPADVYGGVKGCAALYAPYKSLGIRFMPTGGVNEGNLAEYISKPFIHAVGGSWLCRTADIDAGSFDAIRRTTEAAVATMMGFEVAHVGVYCGNEVDALAEGLHRAFGFETRKGSSSTFASDGIELMTGGIGEKGHIAVRTNTLERAAFRLEKRGFAVDESSAKVKNGRTVAVYLKDTFGGFGVHLLQK